MIVIIAGTAQFEYVCKRKLVEWYNNAFYEGRTSKVISLDDVFVVWSCKMFQNYKVLLSTTVSGDGIYAEFTFNDNTEELYENIYKKLTSTDLRLQEPLKLRVRKL